MSAVPAYQDDIFKPIIDGNTLEQAIRDSIRAWWDVYSKEYALQRGYDNPLPRPRSWIISQDVNRDGADQLPTVVVISPGLTGERPTRDGEGNFTAKWSVGVGIFVAAKNRGSTAKLVREYAAIIRAIVIQKPTFDGVASYVDWVDESYDDAFAFRDDETIAAGQVILDVTVEDVLNKFGGPSGDPPPLPDPDTQPGSQWLPIDKAYVQVEVDVDG
jgi:hypothetical protein